MREQPAGVKTCQTSRRSADLDYAYKKRKTRREAFLERMDGLIPWEQLAERIRPHYPTAGRGASSISALNDAARPLRAVVLQPFRPRHGGTCATRWRR